VFGRQHFDAAFAERDDLPDLEGDQLEQRRIRRRQPREVGPDHAVEDVRAQRVDGGRQRVHLDRLAILAVADHAVGQQADGQHMVQVRVADQDVVDGVQLVEREIADARAGVDQHVAVEQERRGAAVAADGARTAEDADLHGDRGQ